MLRGLTLTALLVVLRDHAGTVLLGVMVSLTAFVIFYLLTVFALSWGTSTLGYSRELRIRGAAR